MALTRLSNIRVSPPAATRRNSTVRAPLLATSRVPSALKTAVSYLSSSAPAENDCISAPVAASYRLIVRSSAQTTNCAPSELKVAAIRDPDDLDELDGLERVL